MFRYLLKRKRIQQIFKIYKTFHSNDTTVITSLYLTIFIKVNQNNIVHIQLLLFDF